MSEPTCPDKFDGWQICWCPFPADTSNRELWIDGIKYIKCEDQLRMNHLDMLVERGFDLVEISRDPKEIKRNKKLER